jgi:hypothetical protein
MRPNASTRQGKVEFGSKATVTLKMVQALLPDRQRAHRRQLCDNTGQHIRVAPAPPRCDSGQRKDQSSPVAVVRSGGASSAGFAQRNLDYAVVEKRKAAARSKRR